jgi:hypothetical protein
VDQDLVVDDRPATAQGGHPKAGTPARDGVGGQGQAPHLFGLLLVVAQARSDATDAQVPNAAAVADVTAGAVEPALLAGLTLATPATAP